MEQSEWLALTPEQRVIHYNRNCSCEHKASPANWPADLIEGFSFDPYFHTAHLQTCERPVKSINECECQMCLGKFGIERGRFE